MKTKCHFMQTLSLNVVLRTPRHEWDSNSNFLQIRFGVRFRVVVFNATLSTLSDRSWRPVLLWRTPGYQGKTTELPQVTYRLYHIILDQILLTMSEIITHNISGDRH